MVLDAGAVDRVATDATLRRTLERLIRAEWVPYVPAVVLAEAITGRAMDARVNQTLKRTGTEVTTAATARLAGRLRTDVVRAGLDLPSGIDAVVAAHAAEATRAVVLTTDAPDLEALLMNQPRSHVQAV